MATAFADPAVRFRSCILLTPPCHFLTLKSLRRCRWEGRRRSARTMLAEVQVNLPDAGWNDQKSDHAFRRVEFSNTEYHLNGSPREQRCAFLLSFCSSQIFHLVLSSASILSISFAYARGWTNRSNENIKGEIWIQTQWLQGMFQFTF